MKRHIFWILLPLLFLTLSLIPSEKVDALPGHFSPNQSAQDLIAEVNALRASNDLPPYQVNSILMSVAQAHADYIASTGVVTHFDANGNRPYQRAIDAGYSVAGDLSLGGLFRENIHSGMNLSPAGAVTFWKGDPGDLETMLSTEFMDVGAGIAVADGVTYYVLNAGSESEIPVLTPTPTLSSSEIIISTAGAAGTEAVIVRISTPLGSGEIYHVVKKDEALWSIAVAYGTTIEQLKLLNGLVTDEIFEGQTLLINKPIPPTVTPSPAQTATLGIPSSTPTNPVTQTATATSTPVPKAPTSLQNGGLVVGVIILIALLGSGIGSLLGRKKTE